MGLGNVPFPAGWGRTWRSDDVSVWEEFVGTWCWWRMEDGRLVFPSLLLRPRVASGCLLWIVTVTVKVEGTTVDAPCGLRSMDSLTGLRSGPVSVSLCPVALAGDGISGTAGKAASPWLLFVDVVVVV